MDNRKIIYLDDAIDAVEKSRCLNHHQDGKAASCHEYEHRHFIKILSELPPAEPERKIGKWIEHEDGLILCECSECHEKYMLYEEHVLGRNFCPNCGADMRGES